MPTMDVVCVGCRTTKSIERTGAHGDIKEATGFEAFADVSDGITFRYLCPACVKVMTPALATVFKLTGNNRYAHWSNLLSICELLPKRG